MWQVASCYFLPLQYIQYLGSKYKSRNLFQASLGNDYLYEVSRGVLHHASLSKNTPKYTNANIILLFDEFQGVWRHKWSRRMYRSPRRCHLWFPQQVYNKLPIWMTIGRTMMRWHHHSNGEIYSWVQCHCSKDLGWLKGPADFLCKFPACTHLIIFRHWTFCYQNFVILYHPQLVCCSYDVLVTIVQVSYYCEPPKKVNRCGFWYNRSLDHFHMWRYDLSNICFTKLCSYKVNTYNGSAVFNIYCSASDFPRVSKT